MSERNLNDKELHELIPTLPIEELFLIEFKKDNKWSKFVHFDGRNLTCNMCNLKIFLPSLSSHCTSSKHKDNFSKIQRLFHPKRTQPKNANDKLPESTIKQLIEKAKQKAVDFNKEAQRIFESTINKKILKMCLTSNVKDPRQVFVNVALPLAELLQLEYLVKGEWKPLLTAERLSQNSRFFCHLCEVYCGGVITVGAHFGGHTHMNVQINSQGVRHKIHKQVTKYCRFQYSNEYSMTINPKGRQIYKARAEKWLSEIANLTGVQEKLDELDDVGTNAQNNKKSNDNSTAQYNKQKEALNGKTMALAHETSLKDQKEEGLIGVEYVVHLQRPQKDGDLYECVLCETVYTESKMQVHLVSHDHRLKYCDIHYIDTMKKYKDMVGHMRYNDFYCCMSPLLSKLAVEIEKVHSRALPSAINETEFMEQRAEFVSQIYAVKHACQAHGPSFSKVVSKEDIEEYKRNRHNFKEPTINNKPPCRFTITPKTPYLSLYIYNLDDRLIRPKSKEIQKGATRDEREREKHTRHRSKSVSKTARSGKRERDRSVESPTTKMWKQYDKEVAMEKKKIDRQYDDYRKQPEDHPLYEQEWNRFWKQRRDELISEGIDHRTYNYQAEWVHYFKNRLEELFCEAVRQVKDKVRARLKITNDSERAEHAAVQVAAPANKMTRFTADPFGLQQLQQQQLQHQFLQQQQLQRLVLPAQTSAVLPMVQSTPIIASAAPASVPKPVVAQHVTTSAGRETSSASNDNRPNVINVLRLIAAMEDHLGSLGSKIMELFTKALQLEKKFSNNAPQLEKSLLTSEHCNLLEVAMEKLRGVVYAGLLEGKQANSFNKIIKNTEELLNYAEMRGFRESAAEVSTPEKCDRSTSGSTLDIQKLLNAITNKDSSAPASQQKSLSDTLKELMSGKGVSPEPTPRSSKEEHFRNSSPPTYKYDRNERNKSMNFNLEDRDIKPKLNLSVRIPNSNFNSSNRNHASDFNIEARDGQANFNTSQRDVKPNFGMSDRDFGSNFNSSARDFKPNQNMLEESSRNRQHLRQEFDDKNYSRSNEFNLQSHQDNRGNMRQRSRSPPRPSAGEIRLRNFNELSNNNAVASFLQSNLSNIGSALSGLAYRANIQNANPAANAQMNRPEPKMSMQQFTRNISNYYQNRK